MLKIKNLSVSVGDKKILDDINLSIPRGEIHVIMGPNGTGKSTILKAIMAHPVYRVDEGSIYFENVRIDKMKPDEIARMGVFLLEQNPTEIPGVTNALMLRTAMSERGIKESIFEFNKRLSTSCENLEIPLEFVHRNINESMSGGEKKKNELLQIELLKPKLILLDELDSGLDVDGLKKLSEGLLDYKKREKAAILIITHHTNILEYLTPDKVYIMKSGHIVMEGDMNLAQKIEKTGFKGAFSGGEW